MTGSTFRFTTTMAALGTAALMTGCCSAKRDHTAAYYNSTPATTQYSSTSTSTETTPAYTSEQTQTDRTAVRETVATGTTQNEYTLPLYSESLRVGKREVENGSVRLRKVVKTENATQPIDLRREQVVIDREAFDQARRAADAGQPNDLGAAFQEKEITIDLRREEPVVEVQPYISGRIVAQKRATSEHQNIDRQVRYEDVEVIKNGNDRDITISERVRMNHNEAVGAPGQNRNEQSGGANQPRQ